jgi:hypothetical protein
MGALSALAFPGSPRSGFPLLSTGEWLRRRVSRQVEKREERQMRTRWGLLLAIVALAAAMAAPVADSQTRPGTLRFVAVGERFQPVGTSGDRAPRVGDAFVFSGSLYSWNGPRRGSRVGSFEVHVMITSARGGYQSGVAFLPAGKIVFAGFTPSRDVRLERQAVIGGTGRYAGARGTVTVTNLPSGAAAVRIRLL